MKRRLLNFLAALSLLLRVCSCALWARSHFRSPLVVWQHSRLTGPRQQQVIDSLAAAEGMVVFTRDTKRAEPEPSEELSQLFAISGNADGVRWHHVTPRGILDNLNDSDFWPRHGFLAETRGFGVSPHDGTWYTVVTVPLWGAAALTALLPATQLLSSVRRRRRSQHGRCVRCGYDLHATPDTWPECGINRASIP